MPFLDACAARSRTVVNAVTGRSTHWLVPLIYAGSAFAFVSDISRDNVLAVGVLYAPLVATAVIHKSRASVWVLSAAACIMVVVGSLFPDLDPDLPDLIGNRALSIVAILAVACFVNRARVVQEKLTSATRRAEAAERMKSDVLTNLSQEIRTPLHTLLGVLTLTMATSRPEQRTALGRVRSDGKQLLATIDNLIDLTQIGEHEIRRQPIDLTTIARAAAENITAAARESQIAIAMNADQNMLAVGDPWAMRRILDNLLANAVRYTPPGGTVSVSVDRENDQVTATVSDTGQGLPPDLEWNLRSDAATDLSGSGGAGLALSNRLARAMEGRLSVYNQPGSGAAVSVTLPAA